MNPLSAYIHWPFCESKCPYCDFNSRPMLRSNFDQETWGQAYLRELEFYAELLPNREITTIYFGGGTPSLMAPDLIAAILNKIAALWTVQDNCEITLEANPSSSEIEKFRGFRLAGVNRLSLGVQALNDADLRFLGRLHDVYAAREAIEMAQKTFDRSSFDLIYARKGQTTAAWVNELQYALQYKPQHLSLYQLTIESGTAFGKRAKNEILTVSDDVAAEMFEVTQTITREAGLPAYEISNHSASGHESRHNLTYWRYQDYVGIGPGAHGRYVKDSQRYASENISHPERWRDQVRSMRYGAATVVPLDNSVAQTEALLMGLRLAQGIDLLDWRAKFGQDLINGFIPQAVIAMLEAEGLLMHASGFLCATETGRQRLNAVVDYLLSAR